MDCDTTHTPTEASPNNPIPTSSNSKRKRTVSSGGATTPSRGLTMAQLASKLSDMEAYVEKQRMKKWIKKQLRTEIVKQTQQRQYGGTPYYPQTYLNNEDDSENEEEKEDEGEEVDQDETEETEDEKENVPLKANLPPASRYKNMIMKR
jgi:chromosomal replication initiation ATPase DnaA